MYLSTFVSQHAVASCIPVQITVVTVRILCHSFEVIKREVLHVFGLYRHVLQMKSILVPINMTLLNSSLSRCRGALNTTGLDIVSLKL